MILNKAEINQEIKIDDDTIEKLRGVNGNIYIVQTNEGSINTQLNCAESLQESLKRFYDQGVGFREIVNIVKKSYISFAIADSVDICSVARLLKVDRKAIEYYFRGKDKYGLLAQNDKTARRANKMLENAQKK